MLAIVIACSAAWFAPQLFHIPPDLEGQASLVIAVGVLMRLRVGAKVA